MFIIHWKSNITELTGHGTKPLTREVAKAWIEAVSKVFTYWLVAA